MPDNVGEMFYYGERPWHKKGVHLDHPATAQEAIKAGGLDWRVRLVPIQTLENPPRSISRRMAVLRERLEPGDPNAVLGVVHPEFRPLQNREAVEVFDSLLGRGKPVYHTGGYLGNGEVVWLLAKLPNDITVSGSDVVEPYMLFSNSHDGRIAINFRLTTVRVVCQNTLALAMRKDQSSNVFRRAHKVGPEKLLKEAGTFYGLCTKAAEDLGKKFQEMHAKKFKQDQFVDLVARLLPIPAPPSLAASPTVRKQYDTRVHKIRDVRNGILTVFTKGLRNGVEISPADETLWGALNAVTAYVDHKQKIEGDRYAHILFGRGASLKEKAFDLILAQLPTKQSGFRRLFASGR